MKKTELKEVMSETVCEVCGRVQPADRAIYGACRHAHCAWHVPPDGANGGVFEGDLCVSCRESIERAIDDAIRHRKQVEAARTA